MDKDLEAIARIHKRELIILNTEPELSVHRYAFLATQHVADHGLELESVLLL